MTKIIIQNAILIPLLIFSIWICGKQVKELLKILKEKK